MAIRQEQFKYTLGELDPVLYTRADTEFYMSGADTMRNLFCIPEGGFLARPGTLHIDRLHRQLTRDTTPIITTPRGGTGANANDNNEGTFLTTTTNIGTLNPYVVVQYDLGSEKDIACIDVVNASLTSLTNNTEFFVQVSNDALAWTSVGDAINMSPTDVTKRLRVRDSYRYVRFARIGSTNLGTNKVSLSEFNVWIESPDISVAKRIDFIFNINQTYIIFITDKNISIYRNGVFQTDVRATLYTNDLLQTVYSIQTADTAVLFHEDVQPHALVRFDDTTWTFETITFDNPPYYDFVPNTTNPAGTLTPSDTTGKITLTSSASVFTAAYVNQYIDGNGGRARIIAQTSTSVVEAIVEIPFYNTNAIPTGRWDYINGYEPEWSATRGWPRSGEFFQQRLFIGGAKSRPRTIYGSVIGEFFDFDLGNARSDDGFKFDLDSDDPILSLIANRNLQIFTTGGEAASIQSRVTALTTENFNIISQTKVGSEPGIKPVIIDGSTLFLKHNGHSIGKFLYTDVEQSYDVTNLSLLSSHLVKSPVDMTVRKVTNAQESSYLLIVNSDGTLTFGCILDEQSVKGFTQCTTDGLYKNVAVDGDVMYCLVSRTINGQENLYLEKFDFNINTDASVEYTMGLPTDTFTGLDHLEGETCRVYADGNILNDVTVSGGSVTVERDVETVAKIGLDIDVYFKSLPYRNLEFLGPGLDYHYRLIKASVYVYETSSISINGQQINFYGLQESINPLDATNPIYTGVVSATGIQGWDNNGVVEITRPDPLPFQVLGISTAIENGRN